MYLFLTPCQIVYSTHWKIPGILFKERPFIKNAELCKRALWSSWVYAMDQVEQKIATDETEHLAVCV